MDAGVVGRLGLTLHEKKTAFGTRVRSDSTFWVTHSDRTTTGGTGRAYGRSPSKKSMNGSGTK